MKKLSFGLAALFVGAAFLSAPASAQYYSPYGTRQDARDFNELQRRHSEARSLRGEDAREAQRRAWERQAVRSGQISGEAVRARRQQYDARMHDTREGILDRRSGYDASASYNRYRRNSNPYAY